jgi:putative pyoverdin transport system ATP-binding/permease protein
MLKLFALLLRASRRIAILSLLVGCLSGMSSAALVALINSLIHSPTPTATTFVWGFVALMLVMFISTVGSQVILVHLAQGALFDLRLRLSRRILATPLRHLETLGPHRLLAVLTDDISDLSNALLNLPTACIQIAALVISLVYLGWLSWTLLLAGVAFVGLGMVSYQALVKRALRSLKQAREKQDAMFHHFRALTEGAKELKLHRPRREAFLTEVLKSTAHDYRRQTVAGMTAYAVARGWGNGLFFAFIGLLLLVLPSVQTINPAALTGATMIVLYMMSPLSVILNLLPLFGRAAVASQQVEALGLSLETQSTEDVSNGGALQSPMWESLELAEVTHTYHREQSEYNFVLGPINLSLRPGELVFLVGGNGSGKTTLAKLLVGLYQPESGTIRLNGRPLAEAEREAYRQLFSVVFSDFYVFEQLLGLVTPELDAQAREYLAQFHLDHKVQVKDGVLSTTELSQGQRKRLALLNAYLEDRPCYLFDEWAADQDPLFKELFYTRLLPELKARGKLVVVITHDDKYFHLADRLLKLEEGRLNESPVAIESAPLKIAVPL